MVAVSPRAENLVDDVFRHPLTGEPLVPDREGLVGLHSGERFPRRDREASGPILDLFADARAHAPGARGSRFSWSREAFDAHYAVTGAYDTGEAYEAQQGVHPGLVEFHQARVKRALEAWLEPGAGHRLLDVGCGAGWFLARLEARYHARGLHVRSYGVDASERQLENLARRAAAAPAGDVHAVLANAEHLPFADDTFDVVVSSEALEQIERPVRAIEEMARVLKPGGQLLLSVPSRLADDLWELALGPAVRLGKRLLRRREAPAGAFEQFYAPMYPGELRALVEAADLEVVRFEQSGVIPHNHYFTYLPRRLQGPTVAAFDWLDRNHREALAPFAMHVLLEATKPAGGRAGRRGAGPRR